MLSQQKDNNEATVLDFDYRISIEQWSKPIEFLLESSKVKLID